MKLREIVDVPRSCDQESHEPMLNVEPFHQVILSVVTVIKYKCAYSNERSFMGRAESKQFSLGRFPYKMAISREELAIGLARGKETGEPIQTFVRRLIRDHAKPRV
jgi:hypothetical protein